MMGNNKFWDDLTGQVSSDCCSTSPSMQRADTLLMSQTAVVAGASKGLGRCITLELITRGTFFKSHPSMPA